MISLEWGIAIANDSQYSPLIAFARKREDADE